MSSILKRRPSALSYLLHDFVPGPTVEQYRKKYKGNMSSPAVDIYYSLYGTILNAVTAPRGAGGGARERRAVRGKVRQQKRSEKESE